MMKWGEDRGAWYGDDMGGGVVYLIRARGTG